MSMVADDIVLSIGGEQEILVPSLRHAMRLERREGGLQLLARDIMDGSLTAAKDILVLHVGDYEMLPAQILSVDPDELKTALMRFVMQCAAVDPADAPSKASTPDRPAKSVPFSFFLLDLYRKGTGWLGWTPDDTLDATPLQIVRAMEGRMEMLRAIYGSPDQPEKKAEKQPWDSKVRSIFNGIGTVVEEA
ncbi:hypothetical protein [Rhizobium sp. GN54]|uniref:hypothetical protein n=1 Tax=Rhizobium sp. GN54 TaxID=2898150 RepID=UPI001E2FC925|nr:hypothetical protein [Rhizobium sp. GN54]MCD2185227.1 hypothetical protein [Rhizobium sp. GN54]